MFPSHLTMLRCFQLCLSFSAPGSSSSPCCLPLCSLLTVQCPCFLFPLFDGKHFRSSSHNLMQIPRPRLPWSSLCSLNIDFNKRNIFIFPSFCFKYLCISLASFLVLGLTFALPAHRLHILQAAATTKGAGQVPPPVEIYIYIYSFIPSGNSIKKVFAGYCSGRDKRRIFSCLPGGGGVGSPPVFRLSRAPIYMPLVSIHTQPHEASLKHKISRHVWHETY